MNRFKLLSLILLTLGVTPHAQAQTNDSVDVQDYDVYVDLSQGKPFPGDATLTMQLTRPCSIISLSLRGTVDSLWVNGTAIENPSLMAIPTAGIAVGTPFTVRVCYHGSGYVEPQPYAFGGFHFDNTISYNLGVGFSTNPHVMGDVLMPCRDNFHDKATYTLRVHTRTGWTAECGGALQSRTVADDGTENSVWRIAQPVPTYLVSVSQAEWQRIYRDVVSEYGTYPLTLGYTVQDSTNVVRAFAELDSVVPMFERCFGPYRWGRIGYIATPKGSMEHVNNIGLDKSFIASTSERAQTTIAHELAHAWFGNLITCATESDMWINEGGASFCSEVAIESVSGRETSDKYYQTNLESVIRTTHKTDNGYRALSPMPHNYTYQSTTYDKGWMVWHSLRGYLGDSLFYACVNRLMESKAFGSVNAYDVRDSLSLYSGVDLTDFFNFHVFSPGFVDYHVEASFSGNNAYVTIRQQGVGTQNTMYSNRVPVTFFSNSGQQYKRWIAFHGIDTALNVGLPFDDPAYYVLDYDMELSDAATIAEFALGVNAPNQAIVTHSRVAYDGEELHGEPVVVEHHWGKPWDAAATEGVIRTANRYWIVRAPHYRMENARGSFRHVRNGYTSGNYSYLDEGFYNQAASLDSMVVLYRPNSSTPWTAYPHTHSGNNNDGYFIVDNLHIGEYTLAVVDTNVLAITPTAGRQSRLSLFPNPVRSGEAFTVDIPTEENFTLTLFDNAGHRVWRKRGLRNGMKINPQLPSGTYLVTIKNKFVSLQSKLVVL